MDLATIDLTDPDLYVERVPHEIFAELRQRAPVFWHDETDGPGFWAVTRYHDVVTVNRDPLTFSSHRRTALITELDDEQLEQQRLMMLNMDPPLHTRYRLLVNKGFTPRMVANLESRLREITTGILDRAIEMGTCDFVTDVAAELPLQAIAEIIGVPREDRHKVFDWSNRMIGNQDPEYGITLEEAQAASMELFAYCHSLVAEKKASPGDDIITILLNAEVDGHRLTELEIDMFFLLLSVAGNETTRNLISHGMLAFFEHPDQWRRLLDDPSLLPSAVEEMLRWGTPVMHFRRTATCDTRIGDQLVREGDKVVIWYISANRDEAVFADPYRFDIARSPNEHVAFGGGGPHYCLGANLARLEIRVMFEELMRRVPRIEQAGPPQRLRSNFINGIKHLPVRLAA
ncbi:MAG: cytochrome P450 [Acidimicrobiia bacterium]